MSSAAIHMTLRPVTDINIANLIIKEVQSIKKVHEVVLEPVERSVWGFNF